MMPRANGASAVPLNRIAPVIPTTTHHPSVTGVLIPAIVVVPLVVLLAKDAFQYLTRPTQCKPNLFELLQSTG